MSKKIAKAMKALRKALKSDPDYSWSWLCNIAVPMQDSGASHALSNNAAARVMDHIFGTDMENHPLFKDMKAAESDKLTETCSVQSIQLTSSKPVFHIKVSGDPTKKKLRKIEKRFAKMDPSAIYIATADTMSVDCIQA